VVSTNFDWSATTSTAVQLLKYRPPLIQKFDKEAPAGEKFADLYDEDHDVDPGDEDGQVEFQD